jgi:hypothetical protein
MVVRTLKTFCLMLLLSMLALPAQACFGPKLFLGIPADTDGQVLTSLVAIYIKEKTGIDTERVDLEGRNVQQEISAEKLDYGFYAESGSLQTILNVEGLPLLVSGPRILNDLQFTTVAPALQRLQKILKLEHVAHIRQDVANGTLPMAAARKFLLKQRWI